MTPFSAIDTVISFISSRSMALLFLNKDSVFI
jgi:hypothetical protein